MKSLLTTTALLLATCSAAAASAAQRTWLIQFDAPSIVERALQNGVPVRPTLAKSSTLAPLKRAVQRDQDSQMQALEQALGRKLQVQFVYQFGINGLALQLDEAEAALLAKLDGVRTVDADLEYRTQTDAGPRWIGAEAVWSGAQGLPTRGEGMVIGVIDTGIAATHPAFAATSSDGYSHSNPRGRRFGQCVDGAAQARCNDKLIGIHDFTAEGSSDGSDINGHGTHVASIAAGNPFGGNIVAPTTTLSLQLSGVAPRANLISYKACINNEESGSCSLSSLVAALDQAIADGVDVINYSIGGAARSPWPLFGTGSGSDTVSMLNAMAAGIVVVVAAGNEGPLPGSVTSPANAPWVLAVANSTHDRVFETELTDLTGSAPPRISFRGQSISAGMTGTAPIILGEARGNARCSSGTDLDFPPTGVSNPFAAGTLNGQIVVCERGVQARVAKSFNVKAAGGVGMVLVNTPVEGESLTADDHSLPSTHIGADSGSVLKEWLQRAPDARGRITATRAASDLGAADLISSNSGRGPDRVGAGVLKPNLSAPGTSIQAAAFNSNSFTALSGTSMAAPHVAGAAALIKATHPSWSADRIASALVLSADASLIRDAAAAADNSPLIAGNGRTQVQRAINAGLLMPVSKSQFQAANPAAGGDPAALNLPELYSENCRTSCVLVREFEATRAASWNIVSTAQNGVVVQAQPAQFSLAPGARQSVRFTIDVKDPRATGRWNSGRVQLIPQGEPADRSLSLPLAVRADPGVWPARSSAAVDQSRGTLQLPIGPLPALAGAHYQLRGPAPLVAQQLSVGADIDDPEQPFFSDSGTRTVLVSISDSPATLVALTNNSPRIDLYVGADRNGDGLASVDELLCTDRGSLDKQCTLYDLAPGPYWIRLHNAFGSGLSVRLDHAVLRAGGGHVSGPARTTDGASATLDVSYELGAMPSAGTRVAAVFGMAGFGLETPFSSSVLLLNRQSTQPEAPLALHEGAGHTLRVPANSSVHAAFLDTAGGDSLLLQASAAGVTAAVLAGGSLPLNNTDLAAPPAAAAILSNQSLSTSASAVPLPNQTGRYFLRLSNSTSTAVDVSVQRAVSVTPPSPSAGTSISTGAYYNPARPGHGLFLTRARDELQLAWYSYDAQGAPSFYLAFAEQAYSGDLLKPQLRLDLNRYSWDGQRARGQVVGHITLTALGAQGLQFTWTLDQRSGSEAMVQLVGGACVEAGGRSIDLSGLWFNPQQPGYGASVLTRPELELHSIYLYDGAGIGRWLWSDEAQPSSTTSPLYQYRGFCPGCSYAPVQRSAVGQLTRLYGPDLSTVATGIPPGGSWSIDSGFNGGLPAERWNTSGPQLLLTAPVICR